nr:hypothetical protein [uncultured Desulfobulbus sp.]
MTTQTLTINYTGPASLVDGYWIRIEQDADDETATISDAAALIDALYDLDPCETSDDDADATDTASLSLTSSSPTSTMAEAIEETLELSYCNSDYDGLVEVEIRVIRSHLAEDYVLRLDGGSVVETVQGDSIVNVTQEITEELTLPYPVVSGFSCTPEPVKRNGNTLRFAASQVGHMMVATYRTKWDAVTVKVDGIDGDPGECTALAFHHGVVDELQLDVPSADDADTSLCPSISWKPLSDSDKVTCYKDIIVSQRCKCSEHEVGSYTYQQTFPCPDREIKCPGVLTECMHLLGTELVVERVDCADDNLLDGTGYAYKVSDPDYYKKMCCQEPAFTLPSCPTRSTTYKGDQPIQYGEAYWRALYGANARFVPVPPPGGICGEWIIRQKIASNSCCDGVEPLVWDSSVSPEVMAPNSAAVIGVTGGGKYSYRWSVSGSGFQFANGAKAIETTGNQVRLSALVGACGSAVVTVTDGCSTVTGYLRCTAGRWRFMASFYPQWTIYYDIPGVYDCVTNGYSGTTEIPANRFSGKYAMSYGYPQPVDDGATMDWGAARWCSNSADVVGSAVTDPIVGVFGWEAIIYAVDVGDHYRLSVTMPPNGKPFCFYEWVC